MSVAPRIRVLHLIAHLGRGGTEGQLALVLRHLDPHAVTSEVAFFNRSAHEVWDDELAGAGIAVHDLSAVGGTQPRLAAVTRVLREGRFDLVHSWTLHLNAYAGAAGLLARVPQRWGSLRGSLETPGFRGLPRVLQWLCLRGVGRLVVNAKALEAAAMAEGVSPARLFHLPNAVSTPHAIDRDAVRRSLGLEPQHLGIVAVGNLRRIKNHELAIRAMALVREALPEARLVIIGQPLASEPETPGVLAALAQRLGLDDVVHFAGFRADAAQAVAAFELATLTSHSEGMPNAVLEAMAAGVPTVAVDVGGVRELIDDGTSGLVVPPGDAAALAGGWLRLLGDEQERSRFGAAARMRAEVHDPQLLAGRLGAAYRWALLPRTAA